MAVHNGMKGQDVLVLLKLVSLGPQAAPFHKDLADPLGLSRAEISNSLQRSHYAGLLQADMLSIRYKELGMFLKNGLRWVFPVKPGGPANGLATAWTHVKVVSNMEPMHAVVWPMEGGSHTGNGIKPLYPTLPLAANVDPKLHQLLSLVEYLRLSDLKSESYKVASKNLENSLKEYGNALPSRYR